MTPNLRVLLEYVQSLPEEPYIRHLGITNCRRIAGSQSYSQHSWSNAVDIHLSVGEPAVGEAKRAGDRIEAALRSRFGKHIYELIWQRAGHYDHIHVSTWPKGYGIPPCAHGAQRIRWSDGRIEAAPFPLTITPEPTPPPPKGDEVRPTEWTDADRRVVGDIVLAYGLGAEFGGSVGSPNRKTLSQHIMDIKTILGAIDTDGVSEEELAQHVQSLLSGIPPRVVAAIKAAL